MGNGEHGIKQSFMDNLIQAEYTRKEMQQYLEGTEQATEKNDK